MSGYDFYGNTVINATTGVLLGGGRRNRIHSNTFIDNDLDIAFDNRGNNEPLYLATHLAAIRQGVSFIPTSRYELDGRLLQLELLGLREKPRARRRVLPDRAGEAELQESAVFHPLPGDREHLRQPS